MKAPRTPQVPAVSPAARSDWACWTLSDRLVPGPTPCTSWYRSSSWAGAPFTVTVKEVLTGLLVSSGSAAAQVTVVAPIANSDPEAGEQDAAGTDASSGSLTVGSVYVTGLPPGPVASAVMSPGVDSARSLSVGPLITETVPSPPVVTYTASLAGLTATPIG